MEHNFLPYWYKEKKIKKKIRVINKGIVVLIIISLFSIYRLNNIYNRINSIEDTINSINNRKVTNNSDDFRNKNMASIENLKNFYEYISKKCKFENISVENRSINASIIINDKNQYEELVKYIEDNPSFRITKLFPLESSINDILKFKVTIEVIN